MLTSTITKCSGGKNDLSEVYGEESTSYYTMSQLAATKLK